MDSNSPLIQAKVSKVDTSLSDLIKEISKCSIYLEKLKQESENMVGKLNGISTPVLFLHEFVGVNSFLLKYINFLTEINCKFEVMEILESGNGISISNKNYLNNVCQVYEQAIITELNSSLDDSLELFENVDGCNSNLFNNNRHRLQTKVLEASKVLLDKKATNDMKEKFRADSSGIVKSQPHEKSSDGIGKQVGVMPKKESCEPAQKKTNFKLSRDNSSSDTASHSAIEVEEIKQVKTLSCAFQKTEPAVDEASSGPQIKSEKIQAADVRGEDEIAERVEGDTQCIRPLEICRGSGNKYYVNIKHIISPSEFYVHFVDGRLNLLRELEKQLNSIIIEGCEVSCTKNKKVESRKALLCERIGSQALYCSKVDERWYRVKVNDWRLGHKDDLVFIFLLDYGESRLVSFESLQPMRSELIKYPAFAQRCHLAGLRPLDVSVSGTFMWDAKAKNEMISILNKAKSVKIVIAPNDYDHHHPPTSLPVFLWTTNLSTECLNTLLVEKKCAKFSAMCDGQKVRDDLKVTESNNDNVLEEEEEEEEEAFKKWNPMKEDYESYSNSYELDVNDPAATIYGYVGKDVNRVCHQYARTGKCYKRNTCKKEHKVLNPSGYITDKEEVYKGAFNSQTPPSVNSIIRVLVTSIVDVNQFYCIARYQVENSKESLCTLVDYINDKENVREMQTLLVSPSIGQIVLAKYSQDDCWYRAKVLESEPENDIFSLIFVDYGNKESVPLSAIRAIEPRYLHLPFQAMQCFIYGVGENPEASQDEVMKYLNEKMLDMDFKIEVISQFPGDNVSLLVKVFDQNGTDIGKDLITRKYGIKKEDIIISNNCDGIPG